VVIKRIAHIFFIVLWAESSISQNISEADAFTDFITPEILVGKLMPSNTGFPELGIQKTFFLSFGSFNTKTHKEWSYRLNYPKTGLSIGFSDLGNSNDVGNAYIFMPFVEFDLFNKNRYKLHFGFGGSYHNRQYDIRLNQFNKGITTEFSWAFRMFGYYNLSQNNTTTTRIGIGYLHHSNGHIKLPNQGLNSFLVSLSLEQKYNKNDYTTPQYPVENFNRSSYNYFSARAGIGQNVLSEIYNDKKEVYAIALSYGKVINKTYSFGGGIYYRFYEHYYQYIKNEEMLVLEDYPELKENAILNASTFGVFGSGELLLNHIGIEFQLGLNIYKPFYKVDWRLNQGYVFIAYDDEDEPYIAVKLGELDSYYKIKKTISSRLGLKYYLKPTDEVPVHNFYIGAHLNANLGQADFGELSFGYVYNFNFKGSN
tara:strand:+ start:2187 stop:3464 length:1278 start_codon:yes stop_codon:yes gene_type:complete